MSRPDVIVVGAGIVGITAALALQRRGLSVTVLDRKGVAAETSAGNAGAFAFSDILPLSSPGIMRKAPGWLLDPTGPLAVPPRYALAITPWLLRFWRESRPDRFAAGAVALAALNNLSRDSLQPLLAETGLAHHVNRIGNLEVYESERELDEVRDHWEYRGEHGIAFEHVFGGDAIAAIQPGLDRRFVAATHTPDWSHVSDPRVYTEELGKVLVQRGGHVEIADIATLSDADAGAAVRLEDGTVREAGHVIVCAGAWSHRLSQTIGDRLPLETERGYNVTLPADALDLRSEIRFGGHGFMVTRLADAIRVGGGVELGGLTLPPDYRRAETMLAKTKAFLPGLKTDGGRRWMGYRPSLPDSLPVIGRATRHERIVYAFGHGHLGLTQSSGTAELVAELVRGEKASIDLAPFRPDRF